MNNQEVGLEALHFTSKRNRNGEIRSDALMMSNDDHFYCTLLVTCWLLHMPLHNINQTKTFDFEASGHKSCCASDVIETVKSVWCWAFELITYLSGPFMSLFIIYVNYHRLVILSTRFRGHTFEYRVITRMVIISVSSLNDGLNAQRICRTQATFCICNKRVIFQLKSVCCLWNNVVLMILFSSRYKEKVPVLLLRISHIRLSFHIVDVPLILWLRFDFCITNEGLRLCGNILLVLLDMPACIQHSQIAFYFTVVSQRRQYWGCHEKKQAVAMDIALPWCNRRLCISLILKTDCSSLSCITCHMR